MRTEKLGRVPAKDGIFPHRPECRPRRNLASKLRGWRTAGAALLLFLPAAIVSPAQTFTTLIAFDGDDGAAPDNPVVQGKDGNLYGTTERGGYGTVFKATPRGTLTTLHSFCSKNNCADGDVPGGLVLAHDGNFYGTTASGGAYYIYGGTVFKITPKGKLTTLYSFCRQPGCVHGQSPSGVLIQATDGNFYGTTALGGGSYGQIFKITPGGRLTTLHEFLTLSEGNGPNGLIQATDGNFYGTTSDGGVNCLGLDLGCGTVFKMTPSGALTKLHAFHGTDGAFPVGALVEASDGNFYGTTAAGGAGKSCHGRCGTVFKITSKGVLTTLHSFDSTDGAVPNASLIQATDGNLYGTTAQGGDLTCPYGGCGTLFRITPQGALTTLHSFDCSDSASPRAALMQATNGNFYGTTDGFTCGAGTVFSLSMTAPTL
jgi:uncharacterized repeat protein (TIGR03803 family)